MSGSNRDDLASAFRLAVYIVTAFGALVVIWQVSGIYAERRQNAEHHANQYAESADRRIANACSRVTGAALIECVAKEVKASREDERTEYDLQAQQDSADAAFWMAWISFATLAATIVALWFVKGTLEATRKAVEDTGLATVAMGEANEIARDTSKRQLRAYLNWDKIELDIHKTTAGALVDGRIVVDWKNNGQTPATKVADRIAWTILDGPLPDDFDFPEGDTDGPCDHLVLGPGQKFQCVSAEKLTPDEFWDVCNGKRRIFAWSTVRYTDAFGGRRCSDVAAELLITQLRSGDHNIAFNAIPQHNGIDEDCFREPGE